MDSNGDAMINFLSDAMGKSLSTYSARAISCNINYVGGNFSKQDREFS